MAYDSQPVGLLADVISRVYSYMDEPIDHPKWSADKLWPLIVDAWQRLMGDINGLSTNRIKVWFTQSVTDTTKRYLLPPNVGKILRTGTLDGTTGQLVESVIPRHYLNVFGPGVSYQGNVQDYEPYWVENQDITIEYVPNGYCSLHTGVIDTSAAGTTSSTVVLDSDPDEGYFDRIPNAYLGSIIRVLDSMEGSTPSDYGYFPVQERIITAYDPETLIATVSPAFDPDFSGMGLVTYEVVPFLGYSVREALAWHVVGKLCVSQKDPQKAQLANVEYQKVKRTILQQCMDTNSRTNGTFYGDVPGNGTFKLIW